MELVHGQSLERLIRGGRRFSAAEVIAISIEIARSLKVAHDHGINSPGSQNRRTFLSQTIRTKPM